MNQGHWTHVDLGVGDFVLDAMGTRWAAELGNGNCLRTDCFRPGGCIITRALWNTNTLLIGSANQHVTAQPQILTSRTLGEKQGLSTVMARKGLAFWVVDMSSAYGVYVPFASFSLRTS